MKYYSYKLIGNWAYVYEAETCDSDITTDVLCICPALTTASKIITALERMEKLREIRHNQKEARREMKRQRRKKY